MTITDGIEKVITLPFTFATTDEMSCQMKNASSSLGFGDWYLKKQLTTRYLRRLSGNTDTLVHPFDKKSNRDSIVKKIWVFFLFQILKKKYRIFLVF